MTAPREVAKLTRGASAARRLVLVASFGALALAAATFFREWVLFTETVVRRFLFGT